MFKNICGLILYIIMLVVHLVISGFMLLITSVFIYCGFLVGEYVTIAIMFLALCVGVMPFFTILFGECEFIRYYFNNIKGKKKMKTMNDKVKVRHKKTGNIYDVEKLSIINCTNANDGQLMVLYYKDGLHFVREQTEFFEKFEEIKNDKT